jgi:mannose-6-phosphate isomerase-like protein (cupin superfamily)
MAFDLETVYLALTGDGRASELAGASFMERLMKAPPDMAWLVGVYPLTTDWPQWEMHPKGHEVLVMLEGRVEMTIDQGGTVSTQMMETGSTLVMPPGAWHRARVLEPGRMVGITYGEGTEHRPYDP